VPPIKLRILGECIIEIGAAGLEPSAPHVFALALYLSIERGKLIPRTVLTNLLFPETALPVAAHNLRQLVYRLRQRGAPLECSPAAVRVPEDSVFGHPDSVLSRSYSEALNDSTSCLLLPGYEPPTKELSTWLEDYRDDLIHKLQTRLSKDLLRARQGADWSAVNRIARGLLGLDPLNETATLGLAESMARVGSKQQAIQLLHSYAQDVGVAHAHLTLPSRFLTRRIAEDVNVARMPKAAVVGRATELRQLTSAWSNARSGQCLLTWVTGEKSVGKSRVLDELTALARLDGSGTVLTFRPFLGDRERPMSLLSDMCRELLQLPGAAGCSPDSLPYLNRLMGVPDSRLETYSADLDARASETLTRRALLDLLDSVSAERPLLVCIDDAHCLDRPSLEHLSALPDLAPSIPCFLVFASAKAAALPVQRRSIHLAPLSKEDSLWLATSLCASISAELEPELLAWCVSVASGNPGHLELLIQHVTSFRDTPSVPPSLLALVDAQLQSLPPAARHVLQACATIGAECQPEVISALTGLEGYELLSLLDALVSHGLVTDAASGIACRSSLIAERVTESTSYAVRCLLDRRAAEHLEQRIKHEHASQALAWRIADHWQAAGDRSRSLHWRRVCWEHLLALGQPIAAADSIRSQLAGAAGVQERAKLLELLAAALRHASDTRAQLLVLEERAALSDRVGDDASARLSLAADVTEARYLSFDDTSKLLPELRALLRAPSLDEERRLRIARVLVVTADNMLSAVLAREALDAVPNNPSTTNAISLGLQVRSIYHAVFGDRRVAIELADLLLAVADTQELSHSLVAAFLTATLAIRVVDDRRVDIACLPKLYERCVSAGMLGAAIRIAGRLGSMFHEDGDLSEAKQWCARTMELVARTAAQRVSTDYLTLRIDLALAEGDFVLARQLIAEAPTQFPMYGSPKWKNAYNAYRIRVEQFEGRCATSRERLQELLDWHQVAKCFGRHDDHMEVLWSALNEAGRSAEASSMLREYVTRSRREVRPCIYALRTRTAADPFWNEPNAQIGRGCDDSTSTLGY
jgi:DNA-binding SARP family transcriptional activator